MPAPGAASRRPSGADVPVARRRQRVLALAAVIALAVAAVAGIVALSQRSAGRVAGVDRAAGAGAATGSQAATGPAELRISRDFGATTLRATRLPIPPHATAMSLLADNARVETAYGGGFVNSIDGLASGYTGGAGKREDWFFFVNGVLSDRGAADYELSGADRVWWDYHPWDFAPSVPAVVGQFPEPFAGGSAGVLPTLVEFAPGYAVEASAVVGALRAAGAGSVRVERLAPGAGAVDAAHHRVLVGTWDQLTSDSSLRDAAAHPSASGLFARFSAGGGLETCDERGVWSARGVPGSAVLATARAEAPGAAIWLVTGSQRADVAAAARQLADGAPGLQGRFGVAVLRDGSLIALPTKAAGS